MLQYLYTFRSHQTHRDPFYRNRAKGGETDRKGRLNADSSEEEIYACIIKRIKQQDTAAVSEPPVVLGYWHMSTPPGVSGVDDDIREIGITKYGFKEVIRDKNKTEWVVIPGDLESDRVALYERCVRECESGQLLEHKMKEITLHDVQEEIVGIKPQQKIDEDGRVQESTWDRGERKSLHIAGCGAGKTYAELYELETNVPSPNQVNVICTSGIELANQISWDLMYSTTTKQIFGSREIIVVHSGKSTLPGNEATIDPEEIARRIANANKPVWLVIVYNSVRTAARGVALAGRSVHLKVLDEVHRTAGVGNTIYRDAILLKCDLQRGYSASFRVVRSCRF